MIKEGAGQGTEPNRLSEELVRCLVAIYCKLTKLHPPPTMKVSQGSCGTAPDIYGVYRDSQLQDIGSYRNAREIKADTIDSNGPGNTTALYKKLR